MEKIPSMDINFPPAREDELHSEMTRLATYPWSPKVIDALGRPAGADCFYFHRDSVGDEPSCTICIQRDKPGLWIVQAIVTDVGQVSHIPIEQYKSILASFETKVANPAAELVEGLTVIELSKYRLEDYFSTAAVKKLKCFCNSSNYGEHPNDQGRWIDFLIQAYDDVEDVEDVPGDIFGSCLRTAELWPEDGIQRLVQEYDFALRVLKQSGR